MYLLLTLVSNFNYYTTTSTTSLQASYVEESFQDARYELEDCEVEVEKIIEILDKSNSSALRQEIGPLVAILKEKVSNFQFHSRSKSRAYVRSFQTERLSDDVLVSIEYLIKLHARLMTSQAKARASERRWNVLIIECDRQEVSCFLLIVSIINYYVL